MTYVLILLLNGMPPAMAEFDSEFSCREAGKAAVATQKKVSAQFLCMPKGS